MTTMTLTEYHSHAKEAIGLVQQRFGAPHSVTSLTHEDDYLAFLFKARFRADETQWGEVTSGEDPVLVVSNAYIAEEFEEVRDSLADTRAEVCGVTLFHDEDLPSWVVGVKRCIDYDDLRFPWSPIVDSLEAEAEYLDSVVGGDGE